MTPVRRSADRWLYWWSKGYRDGMTGAPYRSHRVPTLYLTTYRQGMRQGIAHRIASAA